MKFSYLIQTKQSKAIPLIENRTIEMRVSSFLDFYSPLFGKAIGIVYQQCTGKNITLDEVNLI